MLKRITISFAAFMAVCSAVDAQSVDAYMSRLARPDGPAGARVEVYEYNGAASIVRSSNNTGAADRKVPGFRVRIFFDNSANARAAANETLKSFREMYPEIPAQPVYYENPYFKVTIGNCLTREEAIILWGRIKGAYPMAFVTREEIPLSAFAQREEMRSEEEPTSEE